MSKWRFTTFSLMAALGVGCESADAPPRSMQSIPDVGAAVSDGTFDTFDLGTPTLLAIVVEPATASIACGSTQSFKASALMSHGRSFDVTSDAIWKSASPGVAEVKGGVALGIRPGNVTITATHEGMSGTATLNVNCNVVQTIDVTPTDAVGSPGGATQQFKATANHDDSSTRDVTEVVEWSSSDAKVATIDAKGVATPLAVGTTKITAVLYRGGTFEVTGLAHYEVR